MNNKMKVGLCLILIISFCGIIYLIGDLLYSPDMEKNSLPLLNSKINNVSIMDNLPRIIKTDMPIHINASVYKNTSSLSVYRGVFEQNGSINLHIKQVIKERQNVTTREEAPESAQRALEPYGGLPSDAVYKDASITYSEIYDHSLNKTIYKEPMFISVTYSQRINGLLVAGDSNRIIVTLGSDGELLWLFKVWRNYSYIEEVPLISVDEAIDKLERGDLIASTEHPEIRNITIDSISPGYYTNEIGNSEVILEPVWMMSGTGDADTRLGFYVYARKFANFTATPVIASPKDEITFSDTSDASPTRWFWDFGDGTNSTLRNPAHIFQKTGNYTVNLTVWNDMGSDRVSKVMVITPDSIIKNDSDYHSSSPTNIGDSEDN